MEKIRYKYRPSKEGIQLDKIKCPVCGNQINHFEVCNSIDWNGNLKLFATCWSGDLYKEMPSHCFMIILEDLPEVIANKKELKNK